ncbi:MAG: hypothetical protein WCR48_06700 [Bacteroidales bacterium]
MKKLLRLLAVAFIVVSCGNDEEGFAYEEVDVPGSTLVEHDMIVLGEKMNDPYTVANVEAAVKSLYPTKADRTDITPTDIYVRFLPKDEEEYQRLVDDGLEMLDHPMDYKIVKEGDYYQDPQVSEDDITWQYAVVGTDFSFPTDIRYEILDQCYIAENDRTTRADGIDWAEVEREAYRLTGNSGMLLPQTKGGKTNPSGRITIVDEKANGGKPFGVAGVKVMCNAFVKFCSDYTDRDGYYELSRGFRSNVRYRIVFKNEKNFAIGFNKILIPASTSTLGKSSPDGKDITITSASDRKLFCRSVVNNAAYDYLTRCAETDLNLKTPPTKLRLWLFQKMSASSAVMLRHGAVIDDDLIGSFLGIYKDLVKMFLPDITIGCEGKEDYASIYTVTCHEMAHASHYAQVGNDFWNDYISYIVSTFVTGGKDTYGDGKSANAGFCEVGEMWAYFLESVMYKDRYGGNTPSFGTSFWFYPQIFRYLNERGLTGSKILKALDKKVHSRETLKNKLCELYPESKDMIEQVFGRYND